MKVEMKLLRQYIKTNEDSTKIKLDFIPKDEYPDIFQGGDGQTFRMRSHFKVKKKRKDEKDFFCIPAFILFPEKGHGINEYKVSYHNAADELGGELRLLKIGNENCFVESKDLIFDSKDKLSNDPVEAIIGTVQPGFVDIIIESKTNPKEKTIKKLWVYPSGVTMEQLKCIIDELLFIRLNLLFLPEGKRSGAKVYFTLDESVENNAEKISVLEWIKNHVQKLAPCLEKINSNPLGFLQNYKMMVSYYKLKKITPSIVKQYAKDSSRRTYLIEDSIHSLDIYEHRILLDRLKRLKEFVVTQMEAYKKTSESKKDSYSENLYTEVVNELDDSISLKVFDNVTNTHEQWRLTQIFTNAEFYQKAYIEMQELDQIWLSSGKDAILNKEKLYHDKMDKLYEYWILAKILRVLIVNMKWKCQDKDSLIKIFDMFAEQNNSANSGDYSLHVLLEHEEAGLEMDLFYNTRLLTASQETDYAGSLNGIAEMVKNVNAFDKDDEDNRELSITEIKDWEHIGYIKRVNNFKEVVFHKVTDYRPDYLFRIRKTGTEKQMDGKGEDNGRIFILDAKYRNYKDMGNQWWLNHDLGEVCINKYIKDIKEVLDIDITAAFIVHSDNSNDCRLPYGIWKNNNHMVKHNTFNATVDPRCVDIISNWKVDWSKHQIGSFYLVPEDSESNLKTFFAMVFEYYLKATNVCWICGRKHEKDNEDCKSKREVLHCNIARHPLIKHFDSIKNFHLLESELDNKYNLTCPICECIKKFEYELTVLENDPSEYLDAMMSDLRKNDKEGLATEIKNIRQLFMEEFKNFRDTSVNDEMDFSNRPNIEVILVNLERDQEIITIKAESKSENDVIKNCIRVFGKLKYRRIYVIIDKRWSEEKMDYVNRNCLQNILKTSEQFKNMQIAEILANGKKRVIGKNCCIDSKLKHSVRKNEVVSLKQIRT